MEDECKAVMRCLSSSRVRSTVTQGSIWDR